jgi:hypothetical protein
MDFPPMRPQIELQRVHDILMCVLSTPSLREFIPPGMQRPLAMAADCLCWCLHHDVGSHEAPSDSHAVNFGAFMAMLEFSLAERGIGWGGSMEEYNIISADED